MIEKFSDYESQYLETEGNFVFTVENAELKDSSKGTKMAVFDVKCDEGRTTVYKSIEPRARWSYNKFIQACLNLSREERRTFELDYEIIHNKLIGKRFVGKVIQDTYLKEVKVPTDDGSFETETIERTSYKIDDYAPYVEGVTNIDNIF